MNALAAALNPLGVPRLGWLFEWGGAVAFAGFAGYHARATLRSGTVSLPAQLFVACLSMSWQEWYGDWGCYLLYNQDFALLPWGSTTWTTPNKPWAVLAGYGWFYAALFPAMLWALRRVRARWPGLNRTAGVVLVAAPVLYVWNFVSADGVATTLGWWSYVHTVGPALHPERGAFPLVYPLALFLLFAAVALWVIDRRVAAGSAGPVGGVAALRRLGGWVLIMNGIYLVTLMAPLVVVRELVGVPSALVP